jgi:hypothetical protein
MTRRTAALLSLGAPALFGQRELPGSTGKFKSGFTAESNGTKLLVIQEPEQALRGAWTIALSTSQRADRASVDVFYSANVQGVKGPILRSKNSLCPVVGPDGAGMCDQMFLVPLADVRFVRVTFYAKTLGETEFQ